jgi:hypothetical protein
LGKPASDVRVGLAVGLHRNEVRRLRSSRDYAGMVKRQRRHRAGRLMVGWTTDPKFTTAGGQPKDLPITSDESGPTFEDLGRKRPSRASASFPGSDSPRRNSSIATP